MNILARRRLLLGFTLIASLVLLGRWMIRSDDSQPASPSIEATAPTDSAPAPVQPAVVAEATTEARLPERDAIPEIALPLPRAPGLHGRVYDEQNSAPIGDAYIVVHAQGTRDASEPIRVTTAADGTFVLEDLAPGRIMLSVHAPGYVSKSMEIVARKDSPPVEIGLSTGGTIMGRLVAADGVTPVAGMVELSDLDRSSGTGGSTGPAGEFDFQDLSPGRYQLTGRGEGGMASRDVVLAKGQQIVGIILVLTGGHAIRGVITGLRPEELGQTSISLSRDGGTGGRIEVRLDERGAFVIPGVPPGRVFVAADSERRQISKTIEMPADSDVTVNLDFPRGVRLSGRITRAGEPFPNVPVAPVPPAGVQPLVYLNGTLTSSEGTYVIEDVPPGRYYLMAFPHRSGPVEVFGDTVFDFDVPGGQLSGRVLETRGEPIMGAEVYIWPAEPDDEQRPQPFPSDDSGKFTLGGLEPGDFMLTVYKPGYEMHRRRVSFDTSSKELTIQLREEAGVEVTAREAASGSPLRQLIAIEVIGAGRGSLLRLRLDENGKGYLPSALAGSTLRFIAPRSEPTVINSWNGSKLDLELKRAGAR